MFFSKICIFLLKISVNIDVSPMHIEVLSKFIGYKNGFVIILW